ncbi:MAG TPA: PilN domain-containing protein [bacterium]|nr:PilN domain-containing protein [bacterium]
MIRINLLPQRHRKAFLPESGVLTVAIVVIGVLVASYIWEVWRANQVVAQTAAINRKLVEVRRQVAEVLVLEAKIEDLRARESLLQSLEAREVPWSEMLVDLAGRTPHDAWLASASVSPAQAGGLSLTLNGSALSYDAVARFMTTLTGSPFYSDADLSSAQRTLLGTSPIVQFGLTLKMRPLPASPAPATKTAPLSRAPVQEPSR